MWVVSVFSSLSIRVSCISVSGISGWSVLHSLSAPVFRMAFFFIMGCDGPVCIGHAGSGAVGLPRLCAPQLGASCWWGHHSLFLLRRCPLFGYRALSRAQVVVCSFLCPMPVSSLRANLIHMTCSITPITGYSLTFVRY